MVFASVENIQLQFECLILKEEEESVIIGTMRFENIKSINTNYFRTLELEEKE